MMTICMADTCGDLVEVQTPPEDMLTGFVSESGEAWGRPVGVVVDKSGALLVADDVGNVVWRVSRSDHLRAVR